MRFTQRTLPGPELLEGRSEAIIFDDDIPGFGVRLRAGGGHAWMYQYKLGTQHRRITFGRLSAMTTRGCASAGCEVARAGTTGE